MKNLDATAYVMIGGVGCKMIELDIPEIIRCYKLAKNKAEQISILAELNDCSTELILHVLKDSGIDVSVFLNSDKPTASMALCDKEALNTHLRELLKIRKSMIDQIHLLDVEIKEIEQMLQPENPKRKVKKLEKLINLLSYSGSQIDFSDALNTVSEREIDYYICKISEFYQLSPRKEGCYEHSD